MLVTQKRNGTIKGRAVYNGTVTRGKKHDYLGRTFDFSEKGALHVDLDDMIEKMVDQFPVKFKSTDHTPTPAAVNLFEAGAGKPLDKATGESYHEFVAKNIFLSKRVRGDILQATSVLSTRVQEPKETDWDKLVQLMKYLHSTKRKHLRLTIENIRVL